MSTLLFILSIAFIVNALCTEFIKPIIIAHVLLLIDNAGGHNTSLELKNKLTNVEVF
jgi:hypothetical protein